MVQSPLVQTSLASFRAVTSFSVVQLRMSYDLYLLPLDADASPEDANLLLESRDDNGDPVLQNRIVDALMTHDPRLVPFDRDYAAIAEFEGTTVDEAKRKWGSTELNGPNDARLAQFQISGNSACIHWYSGTTPEEMEQYLEIICRIGGFAVYDPQEMTIQRYA